MKFIGGSLCLDFVNAVGGRVHSRGRDYAVLGDKLPDYEALMNWGMLAEILPDQSARQLQKRATAHPREAAATLDRAIALREALYRLFRSSISRQNPDPAALDTLNAELLIAHSQMRLAQEKGAFFRAWEDFENALDGILWEVSYSAEKLLTSKDLSKVGQCGGDECGWLFLDLSRNGTRRWCDMKECGNRAKIKKFRQKEPA